MRTIQGIGRTARILLALAVASTAAGYAREVSIATTFGVGRTADAYFAVLALVAAATDLVPGAALVASLVPVLAPLASGAIDLATRRAVVTAVAGIVTAATAALAIMLWRAAPAVVDLIAPGFDAEGRATAILILSRLAWLLPLQALVTLFTLALNAHGEFARAAAMPVLANLVFAGIVLALGPAGGAPGLAAAALAGPIVAAAILGARLRRHGLLGLGWPVQARRPLAELWRLARPSLLTLGIGSSTGLLMVAHLLLRHYGSHHGPGAVSALTYGFRIYEVPVSLAANVAGTLAMPAIAALHGENRRAEIARRCRTLLLLGSLLLVPAAMLVFAEAPLLVDLLFRRGRFAAADVTLTAQALRGFAPAIALEAVVVVFYRVLYALHRPRLPIAISALSLIALTIAAGVLGDRAGLGVLAACLSASFGLAAGLVLIALRGVLGRPAPPVEPVLARRESGR